MSILSVVVFILVFGLVVLVHELGHFLAARKAGVSVDEFGLGMPPRIWGIKRGKTIYSLNWIPLGGFVRLEGEGTEDGVKSAHSLRHKSFWVRAVVIVGGVVMNFLLAYVLVAIGFWAGMPPLATNPATLVANPAQIQASVRIAQIQPGSAADLAGLQAGDSVLKIGDKVVLSVDELQSDVAASGATANIQIERAGELLTIQTKPQLVDGQRLLGIYAQEYVSRVHYTWWKVPVLAAIDFGHASRDVWKGMMNFFAGLIETGKVSQDVVGPLGIAAITADALKVGFLAVLQFTILLSINLGFVNMLPVPALDGGRLLMLIIEAIVPNRKWSTQIESTVNGVGFILLMVLVVLVTYRDVIRIFVK